MILPDKYINYENSNIFYSDLILEILFSIKGNRTIENVWNKFHKKYSNISFSKFYNSILLLFMLDLVSLGKEGDLYEIKRT